VDRIVPASTAATLARAEAALGQPDLAAVEAEPYSQWVIQDAFPGGCPDWVAAGAVLTGDVAPWVRLKLRVLNGLHSTTAYLGSLAGWATVAEAVRQPGLVDLLRRLAVEDIAPTLDPPPGITVEDYADQTLHRFANPAIEHRTIQVAMDGSQKLPQRLVPTIAERRARGLAPGLPALTLAAWMRFVAGHADDGTPLPLDDPLAAEIRAARPDSDDPRTVVCGLLGLSSVFPPHWREDTELVDAVADWLGALSADGAAATVTTAAGRAR
jgi:fructuronate reductase